MAGFFLPDARALGEVTSLMSAYGETAALEAATRAERSREGGNLIRFCHWRQIARAIRVLSDEEVTGTVH